MSDNLPLFPLGTVLFPGGRIPMRIFEPRYVDLVSHCMRTESGFGIVGIRSGRETGPTPEFHDIGVIANIEHWDQGNDGLLHIVAVGTARFEVKSFRVQEDGLALAEVDVLETEKPAPTDDTFAPLRELLKKAYAEHPEVAPPRPWSDEDANWLAYRLAELMPLTVQQRVDLLRAPSADDRLSAVAAWLTGPDDSQSD